MDTILCLHIQFRLINMLSCVLLVTEDGTLRTLSCVYFVMGINGMGYRVLLNANYPVGILTLEIRIGDHEILTQLNTSNTQLDYVYFSLFLEHASFNGDAFSETCQK